MNQRLSECLNNTFNNRTAPFLWLHWEDDSLILNEIDRIYESGIRAVCLESRTHEDFCRDGWWEDIKLILKRCKELSMKVWILDDKHFPSGYANNIFKEKQKDLRRFDLTERHIDIAGPLDSACFLADGWKESEKDELLAAVLCRRSTNDPYEVLEDAVDVTDKIQKGMIYLDIPEGYWRLVFFIKTQDTGNPFSCHSDKLSAAATDAIIEEIYEPHYREIGEYFGNTFLGFFADEPGFHNNQGRRMITPLGVKKAFYPWHDILREELAKKFGDKLWCKLTNLFFDVKGEFAEAREIYMDAITRLYNENYSGRIADWCHKHNVMYIGHIIEDNNSLHKTGSTAGHYFRGLKGQDMSGIDVVLGQLLPGMDHIDHVYSSGEFEHTDHRFFRYTLAKLASSMAHTNERMNGDAMCEIFGAYGWAEGTKIMKWLSDFMLVRGINYFVPHAFSPKKDDPDCPPNFYASGKNPQYKYFRHIIDHLNRSAHMLTVGSPVVSCAVLYDTEVRWTGGDFLPCDKIAEALLNSQIDFDYLCHDDLACDSVSSGSMKVGHSNYDTVIVPYAEYMSEKTLLQLKFLAEQGVRVIWVDKPAKNFCNGKPADRLLPDAISVPSDALVSYLVSHDIYEIRLMGGNPKIKFCHRRDGEANLYFFVSEDIHGEIKEKAAIKGFHGGPYVVYDPLTNEAYQCHSKDGFIDIKLQPYQSLMVLTGIPADPYPKKQEYRKGLELEFFDYELSLAREGEVYAPYKHLFSPINVTSPDEKNDFSGRMKYSTTFNLSNVGAFELDLGRVGETAEVYINDIKVGEKICPPYTFRIADELQLGENKLDIIVSNTLVFEMRDEVSCFLPIEPSGLLSKTRLFRLEKQNG